MTLHDKGTVKASQKLPGEAYLLKDSKNVHELAPKSVSVVLHENGFDIYSYAADYESFNHEAVLYKETLIRCSLNEITASLKPFVIQLEAGLRTIFICFIDREERDGCFTKILASVGQFLVLNPRSRKSLLGKRTSNPLSPVSPLSMSTAPTLKDEQLSLLLNALDISSSSRCLTQSRPNSPFSFRFPGLLVSICNAKPRRGKDITNTKIPVARSYTLPFSKYGSARSCKQFSARNTIFCDNHTRSSLEARVALGILNTDLGDVRQYLARF
ncbi:Hypothetical predicted protein [Paramuricea clavata]|uniref:Uncharacterized protein n=1 Tax=Paramuricea clavata TaxID=317549 RepID=A0A6S7I0J0_PARCT|nr:Hypothetical predicted protein [Paramuricea clavata]